MCLLPLHSPLFPLSLALCVDISGKSFMSYTLHMRISSRGANSPFGQTGLLLVHGCYITSHLADTFIKKQLTTLHSCHMAVTHFNAVPTDWIVVEAWLLPSGSPSGKHSWLRQHFCCCLHHEIQATDSPCWASFNPPCWWEERPYSPCIGLSLAVTSSAGL